MGSMTCIVLSAVIGHTVVDCRRDLPRFKRSELINTKKERKKVCGNDLTYPGSSGG